MQLVSGRASCAVTRISDHPVAARASRSYRERSEGDPNSDHRSNVVVVEIGDAGSVRNGDGHTAAHVGIRNSGISVETLREMMINEE